VSFRGGFAGVYDEPCRIMGIYVRGMCFILFESGILPAAGSVVRNIQYVIPVLVKQTGKQLQYCKTFSINTYYIGHSPVIPVSRSEYRDLIVCMR